MTELDKLELYLQTHRIAYERIDNEAVRTEDGKYLLHSARHQICVPEDGKNCKWDAICHPHSYGYELGLLEIYGEIVNEEKDGDIYVGYLTAADVIRRLEK